MSSAAVELVSRAVREGLLLTVLVAAPPVAACLIVGLVLGALQSATQIHDPSLVLLPKLLAVLVVLLLAGPPLGVQVVRFTQALLVLIPVLR